MKQINYCVKIVKMFVNESIVQYELKNGCLTS